MTIIDAVHNLFLPFKGPINQRQEQKYMKKYEKSFIFLWQVSNTISTEFLFDAASVTAASSPWPTTTTTSPPSITCHSSRVIIPSASRQMYSFTHSSARPSSAAASEYSRANSDSPTKNPNGKRISMTIPASWISNYFCKDEKALKCTLLGLMGAPFV